MVEKDQIFLSRQDAEFILSELDLTAELKTVLLQKRIVLSADIADELRDLCADELDVDGFDEKYQPTTKGKRLEQLVDKLFIG